MSVITNSANSKNWLFMKIGLDDLLPASYNRLKPWANRFVTDADKYVT